MTPAEELRQIRILITGSRDWTDHGVIFDALNAAAHASEEDAVLVHGAARGADAIAAAIWADWERPVEPHPADWKHHGKQAGLIRNAEMVQLGADLCLAFIRNHSRGATHTANLAEAAGIPTTRYLDAVVARCLGTDKA